MIFSDAVLFAKSGKDEPLAPPLIPCQDKKRHGVFHGTALMLSRIIQRSSEAELMDHFGHTVAKYV